MTIETNIKELLRSSICDRIYIQEYEYGRQYIVCLPFTNNLGDEIDIGITLVDDKLILDDLGRIAGLLFSLDQHKPDTPGLRLVKTLSEEYKINMDFNYGLITKEIERNNSQDITDYIKVILAINTVLPKLRYQKPERKGRKKLAVKLSRDIKQLQMPMHVDRHTKVEGKHFSWPIDYKYKWKFQDEEKYVLIVTADLWGKEPQSKASQVISLATDLHTHNGLYDLRVLFELNGPRPDSQSYRAAQFIIDQQTDLKYKAYNYANMEQKQEFMSTTLMELLPKIHALG